MHRRRPHRVATHRDIGVCDIAAKLHPDHDAIADFAAAFVQVETVSMDSTRIEANASEIRANRAKASLAKLATGVTAA
jgi:hypothetical protein